MMKITFNPLFGSHLHIDMESREHVTGQMFAGGHDLMEELRLRSGLTSVMPDTIERTAYYMKAIRAALNASSKSHAEIFRASFSRDEIGVATTLLGWRDTLVGLGWSPDRYTNSPKLNALMDIEEHFECPGHADCRRELLEFLEDGRANLTGIDIVSVVPEKNLPCYFRSLLRAAAGCGASVSYSPAPHAAASEGTRLRALQEYLLTGKPADLSTMPDDDSFKVYRTYNADDAMKYAAMARPDLIASRESVMLREVFRAMNLPLPESTDTSVPQVAKLLTLAIALHKKDTDVNSLFSFLSISPNPLPYNKSLRDHLLRQGGMGEGWNEILEKIQDEKSRKLISCVGSSDGTISKEELTGLLKTLSAWAMKDREARGTLLSYCRFAKLITDDIDGRIDVESLIRWLESAGAPAVQTSMPAEMGSCGVIDSPSSMADPVNTMIWADCWGGMSSGHELDFLSPADIMELGIEIDSEKSLFELQRLSTAYGIAQVKESLTIMTCTSEAGSPVHEHPFIIEIKSCCKVKEDKCPDHNLTSEFAVEGQTGRSLNHIVDKERFRSIRIPAAEGGLKRNSESYSSLNKLINFPFDYMTDYLLHWNAYGIESMADIATVKGKVAHRYIEILLSESEKNIAEARRIHSERYYEIMEECLNEIGTVMYMDENRLEMNSFRSVLRHVVNSLLNFIEENMLEVIGMEHSIDMDLPVIGRFTGSIDLLLKDSEGKRVIVDMKWHEGKRYHRILEEGKILQLALYRKAMETQGHEVSCCGYFLLPQRKFVTSDDRFMASEIVEIIEGEHMDDHFERACNSYEYRIKQIEDGIIEDAEGSLLADIQYHKDTISMKLYPLDLKYKEPDRKGIPYGNQNITLKGGLE